MCGTKDINHLYCVFPFLNNRKTTGWRTLSPCSSSTSSSFMSTSTSESDPLPTPEHSASVRERKRPVTSQSRRSTDEERVLEMMQYSFETPSSPPLSASSTAMSISSATSFVSEPISPCTVIPASQLRLIRSSLAAALDDVPAGRPLNHTTVFGGFSLRNAESSSPPALLSSSHTPIIPSTPTSNAWPPELLTPLPLPSPLVYTGWLWTPIHGWIRASQSECSGSIVAGSRPNVHAHSTFQSGKSAILPQSLQDGNRVGTLHESLAPVHQPLKVNANRQVSKVTNLGLSKLPGVNNTNLAVFNMAFETGRSSFSQQAIDRKDSTGNSPRGVVVDESQGIPRASVIQIAATITESLPNGPSVNLHHDSAPDVLGRRYSSPPDEAVMDLFSTRSDDKPPSSSNEEAGNHVKRRRSPPPPLSREIIRTSIPSPPLDSYPMTPTYGGTRICRSIGACSGDGLTSSHNVTPRYEEFRKERSSAEQAELDMEIRERTETWLQYHQDKAHL